MTNALIKLAEEDPTFRFKTDEETGQTVIEGMGELHLDIIIDRLKREFKVECNQGRPQVSYRESIKAENAQKMKEFRDAIADYDEAKIRQLIESANSIKRIIR